jgi:hypothetical protein
MPTTIFDSSLITMRRKTKAESGSFLNRIQNTTEPNVGYGQRLGIYDQSAITSIRDGQMKYYRKGETGYTTVNNGCPCVPLVNEEASCCGKN